MRLINGIRRVVQSKWFLAVPLLLAIVNTLLQEKFWDIQQGVTQVTDCAIIGAVVLALYTCFLLIVSDNTAVTLFPFLLLCTLVLAEYGSYDRFIRYWWVAIPVVVAVLFHVIAYREHPMKSGLLYGMLAVAAAVTLGGVFSIPAANYFNAVNLYYVAALGIGMVLCYLLLSAKYHDRKDFELQSYVALCLFLMGLFACFFLCYHQIGYVLKMRAIQEIQMSNNITTLLLIAMPFAFYFTAKRLWLLPTTALMLATMILSGSRSGLLMGLVEFAVCTVTFLIIDRRHWVWYLLIPAVGTVFTLVYYEKILEIVAVALFKLDNIQEEPRMQMFRHAWDEFRSNPLFGSGLGATGRQAIYNPQKFAMNWYHCAPVQIFASLGILGIGAYCYQWYTRFRTFRTRRTLFGWTVLLSQFGLLIMSAVNPGFFCPFPYEFLMVLLFVVLFRQPEAPCCPKKSKRER